MAQYVDIMTDAGFKAVFQDKQVTIKFLNAALAGERQIKDITYLDKETKPEIVENRTIIFDLLCEDVSGIGMLLDTIYDLRETIEKKIYFILQTKYISYRSIRPMKYRPILR